jgi:Helicase conserved C-terminal domain/Zinc finger, C3HC4 type (RING finger)/SNF2-related domain
MSLPSRRRLWQFFEALYAQELTETAPRHPTPPWIKTPLLPHQQAALTAALRLETAKTTGLTVTPVPGESMGGRLYSSYGILGDRVGSGKSLTALSLVKMDAPEAQYTEYCMRSMGALGDGRDVGLLRTRDQTKTTSLGLQLRPVRTSLFLIPHALMGQWETYVMNDTTLNCLFLKKRIDTASEAYFSTLELYDAVFVSSTMWATYKASHPIRTILWKRIFVDEADSIALTSDYDDLHALFYWFISASWLNLVFTGGAYYNLQTAYTPLDTTPQSVVERVSKLVNNQYMVIAGCRHMNLVRRMCNTPTHNSSVAINSAGFQATRLIIHSSDAAIQASFVAPRQVQGQEQGQEPAFVNPLIRSQMIVCTTPASVRVLDSFISKELMERLHAGDVAGALDSLGMNSYSESDITAAVTASLQKELDNAINTYEYKQKLDYASESQKAKALEVCEQKIAAIRSRMTAIEERLKQAKTQTCPICYDDLEAPAFTPCCQQVFCFSCLCESLKRVATCPLCRMRIADMKEIKVIGTPKPENTMDTTEPQPTSTRLNKNDSFIRFMKLNPTAKVLMFSAYDTSFSGLQHAMDLANISYSMLNGSQARIAKLLREFKAGKHNVLFLNARNMGAGLNIQDATHVVLFHRMSAELETQIIGRANRLGRTEPLDVVYLVHENEQVVQ